MRRAATLDGHPAGEFTCAQYRRILDDPDELARTARYREFDDLADAPADDPRIPGIARQWAAVVRAALAVARSG